MKIIQAIIVIFAVVGCLALALGGYFIYNMSKEGGDNLLAKIQAARAENPAEAETTATAQATPIPATANSEYAKIIQQYQPTPTPTPVPQAAAPGAPVAAVQPGAAVAAAPAATVQQPVRTPKPDEGKIRNWSTGRKWVALTYDDGPHPEWTPKMIELLRSKNVKATFYLLGQEIKRFPEIARNLTDNGFEIGNHTVTHPNFNQSKYTPDVIRQELSEANALIKEHAGVTEVRTMRPPYGNTPKKLEAVCQELGLSIVAWDIDTDDWNKNTNTDKMVELVMKGMGDGAIILMHDRHQKTYDTTAQIIDKIREQGYEFVTMSEMLGFVPYVPGGPVEYAAARAGAAPQQPAPQTAPVVAVPAPADAAAPAAPAATPANVPGAAALPPVSPEAQGAGTLPVPSAASPAPPVDESKITQPPPQR